MGAKKKLKRTYSKLTAYQLQLNLYQFFSIMFIFLALAISFTITIYCGSCKNQNKKRTHKQTEKNAHTERKERNKSNETKQEEKKTSIHRKILMEKFNKNEVARLKYKRRWKIEKAIRNGFWNWNCGLCLSAAVSLSLSIYSGLGCAILLVFTRYRLGNFVWISERTTMKALDFNRPWWQVQHQHLTQTQFQL